ncbi:MAG TPA: hypothetical protein VM554_13640 [Acidisarcina sp.]|nr:hypothetical protein [Acidisarcina sp.]
MNRLLQTISIGALLFSGFSASSALAQSRMNDRDVAHTMQNLREDTKSFRSAFDASIHHTPIRRTSRERDAKTQVRDFQVQTDHLLSHFRDKKQADDNLRMVLNSSQGIEGLLRDEDYDAVTISSWAKVRADLDSLAEAFNMPAASSQLPVSSQ